MRERYKGSDREGERARGRERTNTPVQQGSTRIKELFLFANVILLMFTLLHFLTCFI